MPLHSLPASLHDCELRTRDCSAAGIDLLRRDQTEYQHPVCSEIDRFVAEGLTIVAHTSNLVHTQYMKYCHLHIARVLQHITEPSWHAEFECIFMNSL